MDKKPLTVVQFKAERVKRIEAISITPRSDKPMVLLTGKNRQGKSCTIDAIWMALGGKSAIPTMPIKQGADSAEIQLDLGEFIITRKITPNHEYLDVRTKDGFKVPKPQEFLNSRLAGRAENPLKFMNLSPTEQVKALQGMVQIKLDLQELERLSGLPTKGVKGDPFMIIDSAAKYLYEQRTEKNREVDRLKGAVQTERAKIPEGGEDVQPVKVQDLFNERKAMETQAERKAAQKDEAWSKQQRLYEIQNAKEEADFKIHELQEAIRKLEEECCLLSEEYAQVTKQRDEAQAKCDAIPDPDFAGIDGRIAAADEINAVAAAIKSLSEQQAALDLAKGASEDLTGKLTAIKEYKGKLIEGAGLPVPGLGFDNGEVTFNGIPLSQASTREQIEISVALCAAQNPEIGILTIDRGWSDLDQSGKDVLIRMAEEKGLQIWCTQVLEEPGSEGFHIYDGTVVAVDGGPAPDDVGEARSDAEMEPVESVPDSENEIPSWIKAAS